MPIIDREYDLRKLVRRWATTKTGHTCCLACRGRRWKRYMPRCDRYKSERKWR